MFSLGIQWHITSDEELETAQRLIDKFLGEHVDSLLAFADGSRSLTKDQLKNHLGVVLCVLHGCGNLIPFWNEDQLRIGESVILPRTKTLLSDAIDTQLTLRGKNLRLEIINVLDRVQVRGQY